MGRKRSLSTLHKPESPGDGSPPSALAAGPGSRPSALLYNSALHILFIGMLGFLIYSNTFHSPFQWDEKSFIVENPIIRDLGFFRDPSLAASVPVYGSLKTRYIGYLTFALDYKLHGFDVFGYHLVNLAIHLINALLVYFLVLLTFRTPFFMSPKGNSPPLRGGDEGEGVLPFTVHGSRFFALAVALLFVAHPLQTEAVTYVFQRLASLVTLFYLLSLVLYIKGRLASDRLEVRGQRTEDEAVRASYIRPRTSYIFYFLSFISALCAMKTKENAFTLPVIITLYEFLFFTGSLKRRLIRLTPFLLTMLIIPATIIGSGHTAGEVISQITNPAAFGYYKISAGHYLLTQFRVIVTYLRLLILPVNQNAGYDYPIYHSFLTPEVFLSFLFLAGIFGTGVYLIFRSRQAGKLASRQAEMKESYRTAVSEAHETDFLPPTSNLQPVAFYYRLIGFGILWFFITLSVESSIISIPMVIDEYRVYLPSVGFFLALASVVWVLIKRLPAVGNLEAAAGLCGVIILAFAAASYARNDVWKDKVSLWEDVVAKSPALPTAHNNLGLAYKDQGLTQKAVEQYRLSIKLGPDFPLAYMNLGNVLDSMGRLDEAIPEYETAARLAPDNWQVHLSLGTAYGKRGWSDKAMEQLDAALKLNPYSEESYNALGNVYLQKNETARAIDSYKAALRLKPDYADAHFNLGATYEEGGEVDKAINEYLSATKIKPDYVKAHYNLGRSYIKSGRTDEGIEELRIAVRLSPGNASYLNTLGVLYGQKGLYVDASKQFEEAVRLAPSNPSFRNNLERARQLANQEGK